MRVLSYTISQRQREMGIRLALGAEQRRLRRLMLTEGLRQASIGIGIGSTSGANGTPSTRGTRSTIRDMPGSRSRRMDAGSPYGLRGSIRPFWQSGPSINKSGQFKSVRLGQRARKCR